MDRKQVLRVLDANANRAAEGLRTIEDCARLIAEDAVVAEWLKSLRHRLAELTAAWERSQRLTARDAELDSGIALTTPGEMRREDLGGIVAAAAERVTQSLRTLEEFAKLLPNSNAGGFKDLRYEAYDLLAKAELRLRRGSLLTTAQLYLLIDCAQPLDAFQAYLRELAVAGVDVFQLRDKQAEGARLVQYARAAVDALRDSQSQLIVNDRVDVALVAGAAGVHLGQEDMAIDDARRLAGNRLWVGVSTHDPEQVAQAEKDGADYIGCGPTFASTTKRFEQFAGPGFLRAAVDQTALPIFAIGGIDLSNLGQVLQTGCRRIAVSGVIHQAANPAQAARELKQQLLGAEGFTADDG